jgi:hypothetical protein
MAGKIEKPILIDGLTLPEKVMLGQTSLTPGFAILVRLMDACCEDSRIATNDVNPEDENYNQIVIARQQYSRNINKFCALVLRSVEYHTQHGIAEEQQKDQEAAQSIQK